MSIFSKDKKSLRDSFSGMPTMEEAIARGDTALMARILQAAKPAAVKVPRAEMAAPAAF